MTDLNRLLAERIMGWEYAGISGHYRKGNGVSTSDFYPDSNESQALECLYKAIERRKIRVATPGDSSIAIWYEEDMELPWEIELTGEYRSYSARGRSLGDAIVHALGKLVEEAEND